MKVLNKRGTTTTLWDLTASGSDVRFFRDGRFDREHFGRVVWGVIVVVDLGNLVEGGLHDEVVEGEDG